MVPALEEMGIRMLLNERERIERGGASIHLAGIDDAHYYRMDNIEKAAEGIPHRELSILLSHTPEIYRQAATLISTSCSPATPMAAKSACPAAFRSRSTACCPARWGTAVSIITG